MSDISPNAQSGKDRSTVLAEERTDLALERTRLAEERTLMAWIRTSASMIGFGFSIYKFFQFLKENEGLQYHLHGPRDLGLLLTAAGTLGLILATFQHTMILNRLQTEYNSKFPFSFSKIVAVIISFTGAFTFLYIVLHIW